MKKLPKYEELVRMAEEDPASLEQLQIDMNQQLLDESPEHLKPRIAGLIFCINGEIARHKNPLARAIAVNKLMMDSLVELSSALNKATALDNGPVSEESETAKILNFPTTETK